MKRGLEGFHLVIASRRMRYDNPYACSPRTGSFEYGGTLAACGTLRKLAKIHHERHMNTSTYSTPASPILVGLDAIGAAFQRSRWTIRRWIDEEGFPAAQLPDCTWVTTHALIDGWLLSRANEQWDGAN